MKVSFASMPGAATLQRGFFASFAFFAVKAFAYSRQETKLNRKERKRSKELREVCAVISIDPGIPESEIPTSPLL
jgi:hypothetical protein